MVATSEGDDVRLAKFDAALAEQGIVGCLSARLAEKRRRIAETERRIRSELVPFSAADVRARARICGVCFDDATDKADIVERLVSLDADAELHEVLEELADSELVRNEAIARVEIDKVLAEFQHQEFRDEVLKRVIDEINREQPVRDLVLREIASWRTSKFNDAMWDVYSYSDMYSVQVAERMTVGHLKSSLAKQWSLPRHRSLSA